MLKAVYYSAGSRTVIDALTAYQPADANDHRYIVVYRTDRTDFYIDGLGASQLVATASFQSPAVQVLSCLMLSVAHSTGPAASRVIDCAGLAIWDTAKGNTTISDGLLPFRKATVIPASTAAAATDTAMVVAPHPTSVGPVGGNIAHDVAEAGNPVLVGATSIAHGTNPAAVTAGRRTRLYANRAGIPFVIGGHPNIITLRATYAASAQTNAAIVTVSAGTKIVVTQIQVAVSNSTTNTPLVRIGFATATTPTTTGVLFSHPGIPGGGAPFRGDGSGILGIGADDEDVRITSDSATAGTIDVILSYYTVDS